MRAMQRYLNSSISPSFCERLHSRATSLLRPSHRARRIAKSGSCSKRPLTHTHARSRPLTPAQTCPHRRLWRFPGPWDSWPQPAAAPYQISSCLHRHRCMDLRRREWPKRNVPAGLGALNGEIWGGTGVDSSLRVSRFQMSLVGASRRATSLGPARGEERRNI